MLCLPDLVITGCVELFSGFKFDGGFESAIVELGPLVETIGSSGLLLIFVTTLDDVMLDFVLVSEFGVLFAIDWAAELLEVLCLPSGFGFEVGFEAELV